MRLINRDGDLITIGTVISSTAKFYPRGGRAQVLEIIYPTEHEVLGKVRVMWLPPKIGDEGVYYVAMFALKFVDDLPIGKT